MAPRFLTVKEVLDLHEIQLSEFGGAAGIRDMGLLESAVLAPQARFEGQWAHEGIFDKAAAYLFHICINHAFVDGNKRTALHAALVFLQLNGKTNEYLGPELEALTLAVAAGKKDKEAVVTFLRDRWVGPA